MMQQGITEKGPTEILQRKTGVVSINDGINKTDEICSILLCIMHIEESYSYSNL